MGAEQHHLAVADAGETLAELDLALADAFDFAADEFDAAFDFLEDMEIEIRAAVLDPRGQLAAVAVGFLLALSGGCRRRPWFAHGGSIRRRGRAIIGAAFEG